MKHPVLRIKKDAEKETVFHYERDKRLSMASAPRAPEPSRGGFFGGFFRGFFRGSRRRGGRRPPLLPLLLVALAAVVFLRLLPRAPDRALIAGQEAVLRATAFQDALLVSVTFTPRGRSGGAAAGREAAVLFVLPDTGERLLVTGQLDQGPSTLRGRMRYTGVEKKLTAEVRVAEARAGLRVELKKP